METKIVQMILLKVDRENDQFSDINTLFEDFDVYAVEEGRIAKSTVLDEYCAVTCSTFEYIVPAIRSISLTETTIKPTIVLPRGYDKQTGTEVILKEIKRLLFQTKDMVLEHIGRMDQEDDEDAFKDCMDIVKTIKRLQRQFTTSEEDIELQYYKIVQS